MVVNNNSEEVSKKEFVAYQKCNKKLISVKQKAKQFCIVPVKEHRQQNFTEVKRTVSQLLRLSEVLVSFNPLMVIQVPDFFLLLLLLR